jgi:hypothetical protein
MMVSMGDFVGMKQGADQVSDREQNCLVLIKDRAAGSRVFGKCSSTTSRIETTTKGELSGWHMTSPIP